ncbi:hypothetical protein AMS68_001023 [Peltaster fructicola]|uniref:F-box domain-containing protein n=1 Tax=Peltaster fructicola TaxID=286661 RepID=A0A6H0XLC4_9PEZI|nr:hypothetical protein AMS68_001023 [Peltaster fructicola]
MAAQVAQVVTLAEPAFVEQQARPKGRARLVAGLQRISSSHSILKLGRSRAHSYNGNGRGSISCISLTSGSGYGTPLASTLSTELAHGVPITYGSTPTTPGIQIPPFDESARVRYMSGSETKGSATLPTEIKAAPRSALTHEIIAENDDYFSITVPRAQQKSLNFWTDMPAEVRLQILSYLEPREVIRCSAVSKAWHKMCFDGQLWSILDTSEFYQDIPADALVSIITNAGPFVRDLNLRGCVQLREKWHTTGLSDACSNLENFSLEGCKIDRSSIHNFLYANNRLVHVNVSGLAGASNHAMKIIALHCPKLEHLNVSWCNNIDTRGLAKVVEACPLLKDLRAGEIRGWDDIEFANLLFKRNTLQRLVLNHCDSLTDEALAVLVEGQDNEIDYITGRPIVPPRKLRHLDLTRCRGISDRGVRTFVGNMPEIEGLQLSKCHGIVDATLTELLPTTPVLTHLDLEELENLSNDVLKALASSPCATRLRHLSISYCENLGDIGMLAVLRACRNIRSLEMDNTRISDLVLTEAAAVMKERTPRAVMTSTAPYKPAIGLRLVAYDCQNVTWTGVREVLSRNAEVYTSVKTTELPRVEKQSDSSTASSDESVPARTNSPRIHVVREHSYPSQVIQLKCFYTYQPTVEEHTKRVLRGDFVSARRLERKWAEFMIAREEAGAMGAGVRRRRRRAREAQMMHADEEDGSASPSSGVGGGRRRRARSGGCSVM